MTAISKPADNDGCGQGLRNRFFARKRMLAADFALERDYGIGRRRLVNAAVLGWGVVYGFPIEDPKPSARAVRSAGTPEASSADVASAAVPANADAMPLVVGGGLALDAAGRELLLQHAVELSAENTLLLVWSEGGWRARDLKDLDPGHYVLAAHYAERKVGATVQPEWCGCGQPERTHLCETVVFSLRQAKCLCGESACPECRPCVTDGCTTDDPRSHARLVEWSTQRDPAPETRLTCTILDGHDIAASEWVDLACVEIARRPEHCRPIEITWVDARTPRRIVKTNDSLFDLIRGCDLTRIASISWMQCLSEPNSTVSLEDFLKLFTNNEVPIYEKNNAPADFKTGFTFTFTGPVRISTVSPSTFAATAFDPNEHSGWLVPHRMPVTRIEALDGDGETATAFCVWVDYAWFRDEATGSKYSILDGDGEEPVRLEIEIRGDLIEDCSGQTIDANTYGTRIVPSGNGTPGGTHFTSFSIVQSEQNQPRASSQRTGKRIDP